MILLVFQYKIVFIWLIITYVNSENVSKNIPTYDLYIIAYTIQHNAEIIPEILILRTFVS